MQDLLQELQTVHRNGQRVAYTALVETRGSTPQKAGASMLVFDDGSQAGTLGGGCVEAEVKRRALQLLDAGKGEILTFQLDSDYGWDDGLICGGRMRMLVDPIQASDDISYYDSWKELLDRGAPCTEAVVLETEGDDPPVRALLDADGRLITERFGRQTPTAMLDGLRPVDERPRPYVQAGVSYLPHLRRCRLIIVGAGHVGQEVGRLAASVDFDVWVVDDREQYCNPERFPDAKRLIVAPFDSALSGLDIDGDTFCIIVTRGHNHDEEALYHLAETPARYVGLIGSKRKIRLILDDLLEAGIRRDALNRVHAPLGFHIGSQTVPEISVSIVAELIAFRNLGEIPESCRQPSLLAPAPQDS